MRALTLSETIAADAAYTGRLLDAFYRALYLQEVISTRAASIIQRLAAARSDNRPCGILLIALRMEDRVLWSLGEEHRVFGMPEELTQRLARRRGVDV